MERLETLDLLAVPNVVSVIKISPKIRFVENSDTSLERNWETILNIQECKSELLNVLFWHLMSHF